MKELSIVLDRYDRVISPDGLGDGALGNTPGWARGREILFLLKAPSLPLTILQLPMTCQEIETGNQSPSRVMHIGSGTHLP